MRPVSGSVKVTVAALAILLVVQSSADAQEARQRRFQSRGGSSLRLLGSEYVQQELNLTADQKSKIRELAGESRKQFAGRRGGRDLSQEERRKRFAELREQREKLEKQVSAVLTEQQQKRLKGIQLQLDGPGAVVQDDIAKEIGLTDSQREKIQGIVRAQRAELRKLFEGLRDLSQEERREKFRELGQKRQAAQKETEAKISEVLTKEQKQKLEELKGEPVDRSKIFQRGERRRSRDND